MPCESQTTQSAPQIPCLYKLAAEMAIFEGHLIWKKLEVFFICNSVLIAALMAFDTKPPAQRMALSALGVIGSAVWILMNARAWGKYDYWMREAREIESKCFRDQPELAMFTREQALSKGRQVNGEVMRAPALAASTHKLSYVLIVSFLLVYGSIVWTIVQEAVGAAAR